jgi:hypothetical protein
VRSVGGSGRYRGSALAILTVGLAAACGSGDAEDSKPPVEQCRDFIDAFCDKVAECAPSTDRWRNHKDCEFSWEVSSFACDDVVGIQGSVSECLDALDSIACDVVEKSGIKTPDSCKVFVVE